MNNNIYPESYAITFLAFISETDNFNECGLVLKMLTTRRYYGIYKKYGIFCHLRGYSEEVSMSTNSFDLI